MADATFSVKVDDETKERIARLAAQTDLSSKDFFKLLLDHHELVQLQGESETKHKELTTLRHHIGRIEALFVGVVNEGRDQLDALSLQCDDLSKRFTEAQAALQQQREESSAAIKASRDALESVQAELEKASKDKMHFERLADLSRLDSEDKQKRIETLEREIKEFPEREAQLVRDLEDARAANGFVSADLKTVEAERDQLRIDAESASRDFARESERIARDHQAALDTAALEKNAAVLAVREATQAQLEQTRREDLAEIKRLLSENAALKDQVAEVLRAENAALKTRGARSTNTPK